MKMIRGAKIPYPEKLKEEYEIKETSIYANVDADKIEKVLKDFVEMNDEMFLVIEYPSNLEDERKFADNVVEMEENGEKRYLIKEWHKNIYYKDNLSKSDALGIIKSYGDILINDGYCYFGFGNRKFDEISKTKYNMMIGYSKENIKEYEKIFITNNIKKVNKLHTAWEQFSKENPGETNALGETKDIIKKLLEDGMYLAATVEDK